MEAGPDASLPVIPTTMRGTGTFVGRAHADPRRGGGERPCSGRHDSPRGHPQHRSAGHGSGPFLCADPGSVVTRFGGRPVVVEPLEFRAARPVGEHDIRVVCPVKPSPHKVFGSPLAPSLTTLTGTGGNVTTPYHARYIAHELTRRRPAASSDRLSMSLFDAAVDLNPHQIDAAMFALESPLRQGVVLADE